MFLSRDESSDKSSHRPHHPSDMQKLQQARAQDTRKTFEPAAGVLLREVESRSSVSGRDAGLHIWYGRRQTNVFAALDNFHSIFSHSHDRALHQRDKLREAFRTEARGHQLGARRQRCEDNNLSEAQTINQTFRHLIPQNVFRLMFLTPTGFSGWTMMACLVIIWTFSTRHMREYFYNSFLGVHHLFLVVFIMMYYHPVR
jgi:hypothetical protein